MRIDAKGVKSYTLLGISDMSLGISEILLEISIMSLGISGSPTHTLRIFNPCGSQTRNYSPCGSQIHRDSKFSEQIIEFLKALL